MNRTARVIGLTTIVLLAAPAIAEGQVPGHDTQAQLLAFEEALTDVTIRLKARAQETENPPISLAVRREYTRPFEELIRRVAQTADVEVVDVDDSSECGPGRLCIFTNDDTSPLEFTVAYQEGDGTVVVGFRAGGTDHTFLAVIRRIAGKGVVECLTRTPERGCGTR